MLVTYKQSGESYKLSHYKFAEGKLNNNALLKAESLGVFIRILALLSNSFRKPISNEQYGVKNNEKSIKKSKNQEEKIEKMVEKSGKQPHRRDSIMFKFISSSTSTFPVAHIY